MTKKPAPEAEPIVPAQPPLPQSGGAFVVEGGTLKPDVKGEFKAPSNPTEEG